MDLSLSPADAAFRDEVRDFLERHLTDEVRAAGRLTAGVLSDFAAAGHWHRMLADKGWVAPAWPAEFGGAGWSVMRRYIFESECARVGTPRLYAMGVRMVGPVIMAFGTDDQKAELQSFEQEGMGQELKGLPVSYPRIKIMHAGAAAFKFEDADEVLKSFEGVILHIESG